MFISMGVCGVCVCVVCKYILRKVKESLIHKHLCMPSFKEMRTTHTHIHTHLHRCSHTQQRNDKQFHACMRYKSHAPTYLCANSSNECLHVHLTTNMRQLSDYSVLRSALSPLPSLPPHTLTPSHPHRGKCKVKILGDVSSVETYLNEENAFFYTFGYKPESRCVCVVCILSECLLCYIAVIVMLYAMHSWHDGLSHTSL